MSCVQRRGEDKECEKTGPYRDTIALVYYNTSSITQ